MTDDVVATRYAEALVDLAVDRGVLDRVREDITVLADILDPERGDISVPELLTVLRTASVPTEEKTRVVDAICAKLELNAELQHLLKVLIRRNRISLIGKIARELRRFAARRNNVAMADVESAKPLSESDIRELKAALENVAGMQVDLAVHVRPELLGGIRVRLGGRLLDASVNGALERIEVLLATEQETETIAFS